MTTTAQQVSWQGKSGKTYTYKVLALDTDWNDVPGNYIFSKRTPNGWMPIYIGETVSFKKRLPNHEKRPCANRNGATHIHAHTNSDAKARKAEEKDLLNRFDPPCNKE